MAQHQPIQIRYNPVRTYPGTTQNNVVGAQTVAGQRGTLPAAAVPATFDDSQAYYISKAGNDSNPGTFEMPKLTLGSLFSAPASLGTDTSGLATPNNLTVNGSIATFSWPTVSAHPFSTSVGNTSLVPPTGTTFAGVFSDSNYLSGPSTLNTALSSKTTLTLEGYVLLTSYPSTNSAHIFGFGTSSTDTVSIGVTTGGQLDILFGGGATSLIGNTVLNLGQWYYFAIVYTSGASNGTKIWLGSSPETVVLDNSSTITYTTIATVTTSRLGASVASGFSFRTGYLSRLAISTVARSSFPTSPGASGLVGLYTFASAPLMQSAPKPYIVYLDSGTYSESLFANFRYDITNPIGIYAADGQAPVIQYQKGALQGTYGVNNTLQPLTGTADFYVAKSGSDSNPGTSGSPFLTITKAFSSVGSGQVIQVMDSGTYQMDYTLPALNCTLEAASGQTPVLRASAHGTSACQFTAHSGSSYTYAVSGFILDGGDTLGALCGKNAATFSFTDCTIRNYAALQTSTNSMIGNWTRCFITQVPTVNAATGAGSTQSFLGCYYANSVNSALAIKVNLGACSLSLNQSTVVNCSMTFVNSSSGGSQPVAVNGSYLNNSS